MIDTDFRERVLNDLARIERKQDAQTADIATIKDRTARLEVKAGVFGLLAGLMGAWLKGMAE